MPSGPGDFLFFNLFSVSFIVAVVRGGHLMCLWIFYVIRHISMRSFITRGNVYVVIPSDLLFPRLLFLYSLLMYMLVFLDRSMLGPCLSCFW